MIKKLIAEFLYLFFPSDELFSASWSKLIFILSIIILIVLILSAVENS